MTSERDDPVTLGARERILATATGSSETDGVMATAMIARSGAGRDALDQHASTRTTSS